MWSIITGINSFIVWPASFIFFIYSIGRAVLFLEWKLLIVAAIFLAITSCAGVVLGVLSD
jgi:hypothetical protein